MGDRCVGSLQNLVAPSRATSVNTCSSPIVIIVIIIIIITIMMMMIIIIIIVRIENHSHTNMLINIVLINILKLIQPLYIFCLTNQSINQSETMQDNILTKS